MMSREPIRSPRVSVVPGAPYTPGIKAEGKKILFISGQVATDAQGNLVGKGDIRAQVRQVMENIKALLEVEGATLQDVAKLTIYITEREFFPVTAEIRREYFTEPYPASTLVVVQGLVHPDYLVEIEAIAVV